MREVLKIMKIKKVLVLAPHTDDGELGCGAVISNFIRKGIEVHYVAFSICEESVPNGFQSNILASEVKKATKCLGICEDNLYVFDFKVRNFQQSRQKILDKLVELSKKIEPDILFSPSVNDIHQDHQVIAQECIRCFKRRTILQYQMPWDNITFNNQFFYEVEEYDVKAMINALACYKSQAKRVYMGEEYIRSLLLTTGVQVGLKYAQSFEVPRMVVSI